MLFMKALNKLSTLQRGFLITQDLIKGHSDVETQTKMSETLIEINSLMEKLTSLQNPTVGEITQILKKATKLKQSFYTRFFESMITALDIGQEKSNAYDCMTQDEVKLELEKFSVTKDAHFKDISSTFIPLLKKVIEIDKINPRFIPADIRHKIVSDYLLIKDKHPHKVDINPEALHPKAKTKRKKAIPVTISEMSEKDTLEVEYLEQLKAIKERIDSTETLLNLGTTANLAKVYLDNETIVAMQMNLSLAENEFGSIKKEIEQGEIALNLWKEAPRSTDFNNYLSIKATYSECIQTIQRLEGRLNTITATINDSRETLALKIIEIDEQLVLREVQEKKRLEQEAERKQVYQLAKTALTEKIQEIEAVVKHIEANSEDYTSISLGDAKEAIAKAQQTLNTISTATLQTIDVYTDKAIEDVNIALKGEGDCKFDRKRGLIEQVEELDRKKLKSLAGRYETLRAKAQECRLPLPSYDLSNLKALEKATKEAETSLLFQQKEKKKRLSSVGVKVIDNIISAINEAEKNRKVNLSPHDYLTDAVLTNLCAIKKTLSDKKEEYVSLIFKGTHEAFIIDFLSTMPDTFNQHTRNLTLDEFGWVRDLIESITEWFVETFKIEKPTYQTQFFASKTEKNIIKAALKAESELKNLVNDAHPQEVVRLSLIID